MRLLTLLFWMMVGFCTADAGIHTTPVLYEGWKLESDVGGVQVYSRAMEGSQLRQVKAVAQVDASLEAVIAILTDYPNYKQWMNNVTDSKVIEQATEEISYVYTYEDTPWPVQNRFCVTKMTYQDLQDKAMVLFESVPRYMQSPRDAIEFISYKGHWLVQRGKSGCEIEYLLEANPGGHVPSWLANQLAYGGPAKTIGNLRDLAEHRSRP
jgi:hypothetical protein